MDNQATIAAGGPPTPPKIRSDESAHFLLDFIERSTAYRQPYLYKFREVLNNYMVAPHEDSMEMVPRAGHPSIATYPSPFRFRRRVLRDPETHQIVETLAAQALLLLFSSHDYITAVPVGSDDYEKARLLSRLLMGILDGKGVYRTMYQTWKDAFIFGTAILELGWESRARWQLAETYAQNPDTGEIEVHYVPEQVPYVDGPMIRQCDIWDFFPDPTGTRIQQDMTFVAKRFRMTKRAAEDLAEAGVYDKDAVRDATSRAPRDQTKSGTEERFRDANKRLPSEYGLYDGFEGWGTVPFKPADGYPNRVLTMLNGVIVRDTINPHRNGQIPFKEIVVNPITGRFYGLGPAEVNRFMQDSTDHLNMVLTDAANMVVRPQMIVGSAFGGDINRLKRREFNDVIEARDANAVQVLNKDLGSLQFAIQEIQRRKQAQREASGSIAPVQQALGADRMAATSASEIVRLSSQRIELVVTLSERDDFPYVGRFLHSMLRQFLPLDSDALAYLNGEPIQVPFESIDFDADVRFTGSRQAQSRFQKIAAFREAINVLGPNMQLIGVIPQLIIRYLRDGLEIQDAEIIVQQANAALQAQQLAAMQQQQALAQIQGASRGGSPSRPQRPDINAAAPSSESASTGMAA